MKTIHTIYSTFAKHNMAKFLTVLTILFTLGVGSMLGAALGNGYEKVTNISTLSAGDRVVLYCDDNSASYVDDKCVCSNGKYYDFFIFGNARIQILSRQDGA